MTDIKKSEKQPNSYVLNGTYSEDTLLEIAESILADRFQKKEKISSADDIKKYLTLHLHDRQVEVFCVVFLNAQHEVLAHEDLFTGTIDTACIYPREVVRKTIEYNASAVILAHNHPSGTTKPSTSDFIITKRLVKALDLIDTQVLDHFIVGSKDVMSFAVEGLL